MENEESDYGMEFSQEKNIHLHALLEENQQMLDYLPRRNTKKQLTTQSNRKK